MHFRNRNIVREIIKTCQVFEEEVKTHFNEMREAEEE